MDIFSFKSGDNDTYSFQSGDNIGPYRIVTGLGKGRTAEVYLIEDNEQHQYALKILHPALFQSHNSVEKLKREAYVYNKIFGKNRHIAQIYDYKYLKAKNTLNCHCLLIEYAGSQHLGDYLEKQKRLSIQETLQIAWQVCVALEFAHPYGVVHRDLKPQNLILGADNRIKITDFGSARVINASLPTLSMDTIGSPYYIAPEQIHKSRKREIDGRADLYALGIMMYQMLAGEVPFYSDDTSVILDMHRNKPAPSVAETRRDVPTRLADLILKAMAKSPSGRFQSARAMRQAIEAIAEEKGIILEHIEPPEPTWKQIGRLLFYWPLPRWGPVVENIWASFIYLGLTSIIALILWWGLGKLDGDISQIVAAWFGSTPTPIAAISETPTPTPSPSKTLTNTPVPPTDTPKLPTATLTLANTSVPPTSTPMPPTNTPKPPTATLTPTNTPVPPTDTPTPTSTPTPTDTPIPPTKTPTPTRTPTKTRTPTRTPTLTPSKPIVSIFQDINVRAGPGTDYPVIGSGSVGTEAEIIGRNADSSWLQINYTPATDDKGWVATSRVEVIGKLETIKIVRVPTPPTPTPTATPAYSVPPGKALYVCRNWGGDEWNVNIGPYYLKCPAKPPDKEFSEVTLVMDPGTYTQYSYTTPNGGQGGSFAPFEITIPEGKPFLYEVYW